ncbi:MAG: cation:proton antiporter [Thermoleophilaceae bacterium]
MLPEITNFATPVVLVAASLVLAVLGSALTNRVPVPAPLIFLVAAAVISDVWPSLYGDLSILTVERVAVLALIVILLGGGMDIGAGRLRESIGDITAIGVLGTFVTAAGVAVVGHFALGLDWKVAGVLGAALSPTDPAVMFSVLGRREIGGRSGTVLEGEAGVNDPAGIALLLGMLEVATHADTSVLVVLEEFVLEMGIGLLAGLAGGFVLVRIVQRIALPVRGQYPVLVLTGAGLLYAATTLTGGSGFLAVFVAGLLLSDATVPYRGDVERFVSGLSNLAEVAVFLALGLTVSISGIDGRDWLGGAVLFAFLAIVVRPAVVGATLARSRLHAREKAFIAFSGLKGAVPILLAAFAVLGGVPSAGRIYNLVFVVVLLSVGLQGTLVAKVAERLRIPIVTRARLPWELSIQLAEQPADHLELMVQPGAWAEGQRLDELPLEPESWVTLVVRDDVALPARPDTRLESADVVLILGGGSQGLEDRFAD